MTAPVELNTPEDAAAFVVQNLGDLTPAQIADIEHHVSLARPSSRFDGFIMQDVTVTVLYGCRILKPLETMKDIRKMAGRWSLAWNGTARKGGVITGGNVAWIELCEEHWQPFARKHVDRALAAGSKLSKLEAEALFYPDLKP